MLSKFLFFLSFSFKQVLVVDFLTVPGIIGTLQALEVIKIAIGMPRKLFSNFMGLQCTFVSLFFVFFCC